MDVLKTKDRAVLSKPKLIVYIGLLEKKFLNLTPTQKIALKGQKRAKRPQFWPISNKDGALLPKPKFVVYISRPKVQVQFIFLSLSTDNSLYVVLGVLAGVGGVVISNQIYNLEAVCD